MALYALVTAAGSSRRMKGQNKLMVRVAGRPLLVHTVERMSALSSVKAVAVSAPTCMLDLYKELFRKFGLSKVRWVVEGGRERQESIFNTLKAMSLRTDDLVAIHDGARPLVSSELLRRLLEAFDNCEGVVPALPVTDTVKKVGAGKTVRGTLNRTELVYVQTPQLFRYDTIMEAHRTAAEEGYYGTDDASLVERQGGVVRWVEGDPVNFKVTYPEDLELLSFRIERGHGS